MDENSTEFIRKTILETVETRGVEKSACPSEIAREVGGEQWRLWMRPVRKVARDLVADGRIRATKGSQELGSDETWKGPVRLRSRRGQLRS